MKDAREIWKWKTEWKTGTKKERVNEGEENVVGKVQKGGLKIKEMSE